MISIAYLLFIFIVPVLEQVHFTTSVPKCQPLF
nr:MAG TPA: hypothetical protein [Caudoviricetes sp.]